MMWSFRYFIWLCAAFGVMIGALPGFGQVFTATVTGLVTDPSGAAVPNATLSIINNGTHEKRTTSTGADGRYVFSQLLPGTYELSAGATGFKEYIQQGLGLHANDSDEVNVKLEIGSATESIRVTASAPLLDTQTADQSTHIETNTLANLPMTTREPFRIVWANAGISEAFNGATSNTGDQNLDRFGMNGGRTESTAVLVDGVPDTTTSQWNGLYESPTLDSVQEVQLVRNSYDAQYGRSGGGVFSIVTKGGTAQFHGAGFEFFQNSVLDANNYFNNRSDVARPFYGQNQFGGSLGGPIWKSKRLFFFGSYEGLRQGTPATQTSSVPTALQRQGDFSQTYNTDGTLQTIYNPFTTRLNASGTGYIRDPFPNNVIPVTMLDTVGSKVAALYPLPNQPGTGFTQSNNWFGTGKNVTRNDHYDIRADWTPSERDSMYFRWSQAWEEGIGLSFPAWGIASNALTTPNPRGTAVFGNTFTVNPSFILNVLVGHGHWTEEDIPVVHASATQIGMPAAQVGQFMAPNIMPGFTVANYSNLGFGTNGQLYHPERTESLQVNATKVWSAHTVKFGGDLEMSYQDGPGAGGWLSSPTFNFDQGLTSGAAVLPGTTTSGNALASLLLGYGSGGSSPYTAPLAEGHHDYALYVEDSWRVNNRLTLNYGLRWEFQGATTDRFNRFSTFLFDASSPVSVPGMNLQGAMSFANSHQMWNPEWHDFAPRVGLAYKLTDKLVFRGGFGIFFVPSLGDENPIGFSTNTPWLSTAAGNGINPGNPISDPFPDGFIPIIGKSQGAATGLGQGITAVLSSHPNGYTENYSADFQYQLSSNTLLELGYSGNQGRKLSLAYGSMNLNQLPAQDLSLGSQLYQTVSNPFYGTIPASAGATLSGPTVPLWRLLVPYPQYASVGLDISTPGGTSSYNALVARFTKRFSNGLNLIGSYQWSKAIDDTSEAQAWEIGDSGPRDIANWDLERSLSAHDIPQALAVTMLYDLPVGRGKTFGSNMNRIADALVGGWQLSGLMTYQSGIPIYMTAPGNGFGFAYNPPNISSGSAVSISNPTVNEWFNINAFSQPAPFTIGSAPRRITQLRQDGTHNTDISLMKNFKLWEPINAQLRADFLNLTNTPQFGAPATGVGSSTFGQVTSQANAPRAIQFGLKVSF
ncbi:MAG TPA: carboxypeptidase regulatory-like domain-containing protein [Bryobacteraceae bacterium]|jgi:outer membrane receptor protein involved in Fe transport